MSFLSFFRTMLPLFVLAVWSSPLIAAQMSAQPKVIGGTARISALKRANRSDLCVEKDGGIVLLQDGKVLGTLASSFSIPGGGFNVLGPVPPTSPQSANWSVETKKKFGNHVITAHGTSYKLTRTVSLQGNRVQITDRVRNLTGEVLGIAISQRFTSAITIPEVRLAGLPSGNAEASGFEVHANPTVFGRLGTNAAVAFAAEDDVFRVHAVLSHHGNVLGMEDRSFGLAPHAEYTMQWSIYLLPEWATYFDFINELRQDWNVNYQVDGSSAFFCPNDYVAANNINRMTEAQVKQWLSNRNANIAITYAPVDLDEKGALRMIGYGPALFAFPEYKAMFRSAVEKLRRANPRIKILLYLHTGICGIPDGPVRYADTIVTRPDGSQFDQPYYDHYYDEEHKKAGWHTRYYFLKEGTAYYKDVEQVIDYQLDELGADGIYWDEFALQSWSATYNAWDQHSVEMDPKTHTVTRKYGDLRLLSAPAMRPLIRKIQQKGGIVFGNSSPGTKTMTDLHLLHFTETGDGHGQEMNRVHLTSPLCLGAGPYKTHEQIAADIRHCLGGGSLYDYYNGQPTEPTITSHMFPLTPEYLGRGFVIGKERLVTMVSGTFSWETPTKTLKVYDFAPDGRMSSGSPRLMTRDNKKELTIIVEKDHTVVVEP